MGKYDKLGSSNYSVMKIKQLHDIPLEILTVIQLFKKFPAFIETKCSSHYSKSPTKLPYFEPF
jgi:hypothetical protein